MRVRKIAYGSRKRRESKDATTLRKQAHARLDTENKKPHQSIKDNKISTA